MIIFGLFLSPFYSGNQYFKEGKLAKAKERYEKVEANDKYYEAAQTKIKQIDSLLAILPTSTPDSTIASDPIPEESNKLHEFQTKWADSVVKSWKGSFIKSYSTDALPDTIKFYLTKNASKSFTNNYEVNRPLYQRAYDIQLQTTFGDAFSTAKTFIELLPDQEQIQENNEKAARKEKLMLQFSPFDGSHRKLERYIKERMNDPRSYKHVSTTYSDKGSYLLVESRFRGKNSFGALVLQEVRAKVDHDGNVLSVDIR